MPQSIHVNYAHITYSTRFRRPILSKEIRPKLYAYQAGILRNLECHNVTIGGVEDHVHILCNLTKKHSSATVLEKVKRASSKWIKSLDKCFADFHWQRGYGLFSVSPGHVEATRAYIQKQEEHHRKETFQEEFRRIAKKYGVELDEKLAWD